jgi:hypothetical protein
MIWKIINTPEEEAWQNPENVCPMQLEKIDQPY